MKYELFSEEHSKSVASLFSLLLLTGQSPRNAHTVYRLLGEVLNVDKDKRLPPDLTFAELASGVAALVAELVIRMSTDGKLSIHENLAGFVTSVCAIIPAYEQDGKTQDREAEKDKKNDQSN